MDILRFGLLNLPLQVPIFLLKLIDVLVEFIQVIVKRVVLLFRLDKGVGDLFERVDATLLLDVVEGLLNEFHMPLILFDNLEFLLVGVDDLLEPVLQEGLCVNGFWFAVFLVL